MSLRLCVCAELGQREGWLVGNASTGRSKGRRAGIPAALALAASALLGVLLCIHAAGFRHSFACCLQANCCCISHFLLTLYHPIAALQGHGAHAGTWGSYLLDFHGWRLQADVGHIHGLPHGGGHSRTAAGAGHEVRCVYTASNAAAAITDAKRESNRGLEPALSCVCSPQRTD